MVQEALTNSSVGVTTKFWDSHWQSRSHGLITTNTAETLVMSHRDLGWVWIILCQIKKKQPEWSWPTAEIDEFTLSAAITGYDKRSRIFWRHKAKYMTSQFKTNCCTTLQGHLGTKSRIIWEQWRRVNSSIGEIFCCIHFLFFYICILSKDCSVLTLI